MKEKMVIWDQVCISDPNITKPIPMGGFSLTAIDAQAQVKRATEVFGPFGIGWGIENEVRHFEDGWLYYTGVLFYNWEGKTGKVAICSERKLGKECMKSTQTDALTKGLSRIGFNSDIFEGTFDGNQYVHPPKPAINKPQAPAKPVNNSETFQPSEKVKYGIADLKKKSYEQCTKSELKKNREYFGDPTSDKSAEMITHINTIDAVLALKEEK